MKTSNLLAGAAALLMATVMVTALAPAVLSAGIVLLSLIVGTVWMGAVHDVLGEHDRRRQGGRVPVRLHRDDRRRR